MVVRARHHFAQSELENHGCLSMPTARWAKYAALLLLPLLAACAAPSEKLTLAPASFADLHGWQTDRHDEALAAFMRNCEALLKRNPQVISGQGLLAAPASVWQEPCRAAQQVETGEPEAARLFFENYFRPFRASNNGKEQGLFTGYYEPDLSGSLKPTARHQCPLYRLPPDLAKDKPYLTRAEIESGALKGKGLELLWTDDPVGLFCLQVQGSGRVRLSDGRMVRVGYAGKNNQPYVSLGKLMGDRGLIPKDQVNFFTIRQWLRAHPREAKALMQENSSYVFFRTLEEEGAIGGSGAVLTPQRSLAVDVRYIPYPTPLFLETTPPQTDVSPAAPFERLMIAQDTGGAIRGPVRGDVFFGPGAQAEMLAGMMKQRGRYTLLLPNALAQKIEGPLSFLPLSLR